VRGHPLAPRRTPRTGLRGLRIGLPSEYYFEDLDGDVAGVVDRAIDALSALGAEVRMESIPWYEPLVSAMSGLGVEAFVWHRKWLAERLDDYGRDVQVRLLSRQLTTGADYAAALRARRLLSEAYRSTLVEVDLFVTPSVPVSGFSVQEADETGVEPPRRNPSVLNRNTRVANWVGLPAITVPTGFTSTGLPVGLQLIGRAFEEETLVDVAEVYEAATDWDQRPPPLFADEVSQQQFSDGAPNAQRSSQ
jgi:aspartyl-tRNA(Asn)/glutamyl-tRNA(Gln) amidotransferase subunit A